MFVWEGWGIVRPWATGFTVWSYRTDDAINVVTSEGYFDPLKDLSAVQPEDWIIGYGSLESPIELVIAGIGQHVTVEPLSRWFERTCSRHPIH